MPEQDLDLKLISYSKSQAYPFHMPGAKRMGFGLPDPYTIDITEISGFDNLNHPEEVYRDLNRRIATLYGADKAFAMVNGSTGGNYVMMHVALRPGDTVLLARNCHKSVWHQAELRGLQTVTIQPEVEFFDGNPLVTYVSPHKVKEKLKDHPEIKAFLLTSPTYEGISSDIPALAQVCHQAGIPLLVDAAHGAHFSIGHNFLKNPIELGADLAVVSLHKTLPALTQTAAVLYRENSYISAEAVEGAIPYYQTSSPSYVLMASVARCVRYLEEEGQRPFQELEGLLKEFYSELRCLKNLRLWPIEDRDASRILVFAPVGVLTGARLSAILREQYEIEAEYAMGQQVLLMATICDTKEGFRRLRDAMLEIDETLENASSKEDVGTAITPGNEEPVNLSNRQPEKCYEIYEVQDFPREAVPLEHGVGRIATEQLAIYPPGIPLCLPGEVIEEAHIRSIKKALDDHLEVDGVKSGNITVVCET